MTDPAQERRRQPLYGVLATKQPDYLYCVVRDWNWANGTWLLRWIAARPTCTRSTAQLIFWGCEPETFLPTDGQPVSTDTEEYTLAELVLGNWKAGLYPADAQSLGERLRTAVAGARFRTEDGTWYRPGEVGWFHAANPVPLMTAYRAAEARCEPGSLPWTVPDDLGRVQRLRLPGYTEDDLVEGVPEDFVDLLDEDEPV